MKVRIGIADTDRVIEMEVDDPADFEQAVEDAFAGTTSLLWFEDTKKRRIGVPRERIAFVEIETVSDRPRVGFTP
ncbi:MAG: hypothetical protein KatS3mg011_0760 [Acidimicrobiia bacterium]|nr:MAG: hypothetical protein KatS3mg011_0760 [Acidimicrobiia bacterium]